MSTCKRQSLPRPVWCCIAILKKPRYRGFFYGKRYDKLNKRPRAGRIVKALRCTYWGLKAAYKKGRSAFRQELTLHSSFLLFRCRYRDALVSTDCGYIIKVLVVELLNSAIEALTDRCLRNYIFFLGALKIWARLRKLGIVDCRLGMGSQYLPSSQALLVMVIF